MKDEKLVAGRADCDIQVSIIFNSITLKQAEIFMNYFAPHQSLERVCDVEMFTQFNFRFVVFFYFFTARPAQSRKHISIIKANRLIKVEKMFLLFLSHRRHSFMCSLHFFCLFFFLLFSAWWRNREKFSFPPFHVFLMRSLASCESLSRLDGSRAYTPFETESFYPEFMLERFASWLHTGELFLTSPTRSATPTHRSQSFLWHSKWFLSSAYANCLNPNDCRLLHHRTRRNPLRLPPRRLRPQTSVAAPLSLIFTSRQIPSIIRFERENFFFTFLLLFFATQEPSWGEDNWKLWLMTLATLEPFEVFRNFRTFRNVHFSSYFN